MAATRVPSALDSTQSTLRTGSFRLYFEDERWEWSAEAAQIHGHDPVPMTLTNEQLMSYKHPDDRPKILANMEHLRRTKQVLSSRYRMIDARGETHELIVVGQVALPGGQRQDPAAGRSVGAGLPRPEQRAGTHGDPTGVRQDSADGT